MMELLRELFAANFMPHIMCLRGAGVVGLHVGSDLLIALAYFVIPFALRYFVRRRPDIEFSWIFLLFGVFILGCGFTHVLAIWTLWHPIYRFEAVVKILTAAASVLTALCLTRIMPQLLAVPSPAQLQAQIAERIQAEAEVLRLNADLERRVAERTAELQASNRRLEMALEAGSIGTWEFDPQTGTIISDARCRLALGIDPQTEFNYPMFLEALLPEDRGRVEEAVKAALTCEEPCRYDIEYRVIGPADGVLRHVHAQGQAFYSDDARRKLTHFVGTVVDITARKQVEKALRQANFDLQQFAYAAAHDLQEPLRNISVSVELLDLAWRDRWDDDARALVQQSIEGSRRVHRMVKDLLSYVTAVEDRQQCAQTATESEGALKDALANLSNKITETQAQITYGSLPDLRVSRIHLLQLFQNMIGNAIKYRRPEVRPEIKIRAGRTADKWTFEIADNGLGFDPMYAERIFGIFKRLHGRHEYDGNGMGLAICARIVNHYGGRIWAEGKLGEGANFRFTLPG
ncbi:MAG: PAS domain-containing protein [Acidobacteriaceae bacterium]|nr:PAS domain-containing protein [Acidobacteriaceae bacterium]